MNKKTQSTPTESRLMSFAKGCTMIAPFAGLIFWGLDAMDVSMPILLGAYAHTVWNNKTTAVLTSFITTGFITLFLIGFVIGLIQVATGGIA